MRVGVLSDGLAQPAVAARHREFLVAAAVTKSASKPFWIAWYAMATARCVFPRPGLPVRMSERPSVTKSAERYQPMSGSRTVNWSVKLKSSTVLRKGKPAARETFRSRVCCRCATSSAKSTSRSCS
jgi:hypothetical protein